MMQINLFLWAGLLAFVLPSTTVMPQQAPAPTPSEILIDDFEAYEDGGLPIYEEGGLPVGWKYWHDKKMVWLEDQHMRPKEKFTVVEEDGNKVLRVYTDGEAVHLSMGNEPDGFDWDLKTHPRLRWDWRAHRLPEGAREDEDKYNDSGAGFYVFYKIEGFLFKRPKGIKYSYSSTLPVGTVANYGKLKVIIVSSALDGLGEWHQIERDVVADYKMVFGEDPPERPLFIRLWGDSDNMKTVGEADFDNITLLPPK